MPGLRLGFLVTPDCAVDVVNKMRMSLNIATAIPSQKLGLRLLECAEQVIPKHREYLSTRRRVAIDVCRAAGLPLVNEGRGDGFYVCGDLRSIRMGSVEFANRLLDVAQVTVCPGADFVADGDPGFVRINLAVDLAKLKTGLQRVGEFYNATLEAQEGGPMARSLAIRHV
jgi:aspartate/methionine/tyrosine aminotransferase